MKSIAKPARPDKAASQGARESGLIELLCNEKGRRYFGRGWALRAEVLAAIQTGSRSLYSISAEYHVSRQAVSKIAKRARGIYGTTTGG